MANDDPLPPTVGDRWPVVPPGRSPPRVAARRAGDPILACPRGLVEQQAVSVTAENSDIDLLPVREPPANAVSPALGLASRGSLLPRGSRAPCSQPGRFLLSFVTVQTTGNSAPVSAAVAVAPLFEHGSREVSCDDVSCPDPANNSAAESQHATRAPTTTSSVVTRSAGRPHTHVRTFPAISDPRRCRRQFIIGRVRIVSPGNSRCRAGL